MRSTNGKTVAWHTLESLAGLLRRHRADDSVSKAIAKLTRADLIIVDDVGLLPVSPDAAEALFRVVDAAYERRSIALTSKHPPRRLRRADAQEPRRRHRRPATAPRARADHRRRRVLPARPSNRRQGGDAPGQLNRAAVSTPLRPTASAPSRRAANPTPWGEPMATSGEKRWPPVGRTDGRTWGETDGH